MNKMRNILRYVEAIPRITKLLAKDKIEVNFSGESAYTVYNKLTGKIETVNLPSLPSNVTEKVLDLTMGFMFHELGHVNHTDFSALNTLSTKEQENKGLIAICNMLEDTYVERKVTPTFLESKKYLSHCRNYVVEETVKQLAMLETKEQKFAAGLIPTIRYLAGQVEFERLADEMRCPELEFLWKHEEDIKNINSSQEVVNLARILYEEIKQWFDKVSQDFDNSPKQDGKKSEQQSKGNNGSGKSKSEKDDKSNDSKDSKSEGSSDDSKDDSKNDSNENGDSNSNDSNGSDGSEDKQNKSNEDNGNGNNQDKMSSLNKALEDMNNAMDPYSKIKSSDSGRGKHTPCEAIREQKKENGKAYQVATRKYDEFYTIPSDYNSCVMDKIKPNVNVSSLQARLIRLFAARNRTLITRNKKSGKLCSSNLYKLRLTDDRVFQTKTETESINTAITLLIDLSGSMSGSKARCATSAAYLFSEILERLKIPYEVLGFSTGRECIDGPGRQSSVKIGIFKSFSEKLTLNVKGRFCAFYEDKQCPNYMNCNADGDSILMAQTNLLKRPEQRKLMFVLSDGYPSCYGCNGEEVTHLKQVVKAIVDSKEMEIYGIGIQSKAVKDFYPNYSVLDKPEELSNIIVEQLSKNLLR